VSWSNPIALSGCQENLGGPDVYVRKPCLRVSALKHGYCTMQYSSSTSNHAGLNNIKRKSMRKRYSIASQLSIILATSCPASPGKIFSHGKDKHPSRTSEVLHTLTGSLHLACTKMVITTQVKLIQPWTSLTDYVAWFCCYTGSL
jgi:hypothetical protein